MKDVVDFFRNILDSSDWPPRWHCGNWTEFHGWLYIISDLLIWSAYFAIPIVIIKYVSRKQGTGFVRLYFLFAAFILACGSTHFLDAVAFWVPLYRLSALVRLITGVISWITVFQIVKYLPLALLLKPAKELEQEIDQRKKAEEKQELLASIIDSCDEAIYSNGLDGIITSWNRGAARLFGYSPGEALGKNISILIARNLVEDEDLIIKKVVNGECIEQHITERLRKDGSSVQVSLNVAPIKDCDNNIIGASRIARDITEQRDAEKKSRQSETIYKTIASSIPGAVIYIIDPEYRYLLIEGDILRKLGYKKEELIGKKAETVLTAENYAFARPAFERVFRGETFSLERRILECDLLSKYVPLKDENDVIYNAMIVVTDVTEMKKAQKNIAELNINLEHKVAERTEQLAIINKELDAFTFSVSHDLRAPLRIIDGFVDILLREQAAQLDEEGKRILGIVTKNARKMGQLIDDLLNLSRLGRQEIVTTRVDMNKLLQLAMDEQLPLYKSVDPTINVDPLLEATCDHNLMLQVWINLISNALKYSSKSAQPVIHISSSQSGDSIIYSIADNGVGFDMKYADKLFGVFQRLHKATEFEGTGVGLALVQRIVVKHGGSVWAESEKGKGSQFFFSLPLKNN